MHTNDCLNVCVGMAYLSWLCKSVGWGCGCRSPFALTCWTKEAFVLAPSCFTAMNELHWYSQRGTVIRIIAVLPLSPSSFCLANLEVLPQLYLTLDTTCRDNTGSAVTSTAWEMFASEFAWWCKFLHMSSLIKLKAPCDQTVTSACPSKMQNKLWLNILPHMTNPLIIELLRKCITSLKGSQICSVINNSTPEAHMIHELHQIHFSLFYHSLYRCCIRAVVWEMNMSRSVNRTRWLSLYISSCI